MELFKLLLMTTAIAGSLADQLPDDYGIPKPHHTSYITPHSYEIPEIAEPIHPTYVEVEPEAEIPSASYGIPEGPVRTLDSSFHLSEHPPKHFDIIDSGEIETDLFDIFGEGPDNDHPPLIQFHPSVTTKKPVVLVEDYGVPTAPSVEYSAPITTTTTTPAPTTTTTINEEPTEPDFEYSAPSTTFAIPTIEYEAPTTQEAVYEAPTTTTPAPTTITTTTTTEPTTTTATTEKVVEIYGPPEEHPPGPFADYSPPEHSYPKPSYSKPSYPYPPAGVPDLRPQQYHGVHSMPYFLKTAPSPYVKISGIHNFPFHLPRYMFVR